MLSPLVCLLALILDQRPGKSPQLDPVVAFARLAAALGERLHAGDHLGAGVQRLRGILGLLLLVVPVSMLAAGLAAVPYAGVLADLAVLYFALDARRLRDTLLAVDGHLQAGELDTARTGLASLSQQDTRAMDAETLSRLAVEFTLEQPLDRLFAIIFWYLLAGAGGVVGYWTVSQLDRNWGHANPRYRHFGWAAARLDDLLNWPPTQLTALGYALMGRGLGAWRCWRSQRRRWKSPKGGALLAAGGGALGLQLGGATRYFEQPVQHPALGEGLLPSPRDPRRARHLVYRTLGLWLGLPLLVAVFGL